MKITVDEFQGMSDEELNDEVMSQLGWDKLPYPAIPEWQRPTEHGVETFGNPDWIYNLTSSFKLISEVGKDPDIYVRISIKDGKCKTEVLEAPKDEPWYRDLVSVIDIRIERSLIIAWLVYVQWKKEKRNG